MVSGMPSQSENEATAATSEVVMDEQELLALGKRHMLLDEYATAVEHFANACQQLASKHGDMGKECAPAYLMYGRCLLEMARQNLGIVEPESAKAKGSEDKKDEPGSSAEKRDIGEIAECNEDDNEEGDDEEDGDDDNEEEDKDGEANEDAAASHEKEKVAQTEEGEGEGEEEEEEEDEADSYLKLAWTFLDLAKVIFLKEKSVEGDFAAADCLMALGEVSMEGGNCDAGAKDMREAIHLRRLHSGRCDRIVAGSEYELGAALHQFQRYDEALVSLQECLSILTELSEKLAEKLKTTTDKEEEDNLLTQAKEFNELINDVKDKIAEVEEERSMRDMVKNELADKALAKLAEGCTAVETQPEASTVQNCEVKTLTARRKPTSSDAQPGVAPSPARLGSSIMTSLASAADSPATKSRVAALISMQLKRHRVDSPSTANGSANDDPPAKRPASSNGLSNGHNGNGDAEDDSVTSKRIKSADGKLPDSAANNENSS